MPLQGNRGLGQILVLRNQDIKIAGFSDKMGKKCKVMFLNTRAITGTLTRTAIDNSKNGYTEEDKRGKTGSEAYPEAVL